MAHPRRRSDRRRLPARLLIALATLIGGCAGECYFPIEIQGSYLLQEQQIEGTQMVAVENDPAGVGFALGVGAGGAVVEEQHISYSEVSIDSDSISPWGRCHRRRDGHGVILLDSSGPEDCMRCFQLVTRSESVVHVLAESLGVCYTTEEAARASCPGLRASASLQLRGRSGDARLNEYLLYRKEPQSGSFCPFAGRYLVALYQRRSRQPIHCGMRPSTVNQDPQTEMATCPRGDRFLVRFAGCPQMAGDSAEFVCLGDWASPSKDERFLALLDTSGDPDRPMYRCGLYRQDDSGQFLVSLAADSTCDVKSGQEGYETLALIPFKPQPLPDIVQRAHCAFPDFAQGPWGHAELSVAGGVLVMHDARNAFTTATVRCLQPSVRSSEHRYPVYLVTQCGDDQYACLRFQNRSPSVFEMQFGKAGSSPADNICEDERFDDAEWITLGRGPAEQTAQSASCPIVGDYIGLIPGSTGLCARIASDCNNPDIMFYTVYNCENETHLIEEREYKCLGNWEEDEGVIYSFTHRRDINGFHCFSGRVTKDGEEAFIREAGDSCTRGEDPSIFGMRIARQFVCPGHSVAPSANTRGASSGQAPSAAATAAAAAAAGAVGSISRGHGPSYGGRQSATASLAGRRAGSTLSSSSPSSSSSSSLSAWSSGGVVRSSVQQHPPLRAPANVAGSLWIGGRSSSSPAAGASSSDAQARRGAAGGPGGAFWFGGASAGPWPRHRAGQSASEELDRYNEIPLAAGSPAAASSAVTAAGLAAAPGGGRVAVAGAGVVGLLAAVGVSTLLTIV